MGLTYSIRSVGDRDKAACQLGTCIQHQVIWVRDTSSGQLGSGIQHQVFGSGIYIIRSGYSIMSVEDMDTAPGQ